MIRKIFFLLTAATIALSPAFSQDQISRKKPAPAVKQNGKTKTQNAKKKESTIPRTSTDKASRQSPQNSSGSNTTKTAETPTLSLPIILNGASVSTINNYNNFERTYGQCQVEIDATNRESDGFSCFEIKWKSPEQDYSHILCSSSNAYPEILNVSEQKYKKEVLSQMKTLGIDESDLKFYYELKSTPGSDHRYTYDAIACYKISSTDYFFCVKSATFDDRTQKMIFLDNAVVRISPSKYQQLAELFRQYIPKTTVPR